MWVDWAKKNWKRIPRHDRDLIGTELEQAFERDDRARVSFKGGILPLGQIYDRQQWERVRALYKKGE